MSLVDNKQHISVTLGQPNLTSIKKKLAYTCSYLKASESVMVELAQTNFIFKENIINLNSRGDHWDMNRELND